jgi:hypothetical protein
VRKRVRVCCKSDRIALNVPPSAIKPTRHVLLVLAHLGFGTRFLGRPAPASRGLGGESGADA